MKIELDSIPRELSDEQLRSSEWHLGLRHCPV